MDQRREPDGGDAMENDGAKQRMAPAAALRYRVAETLAAVAMMVMIVVMAGLGTMIVGR